MSYTHKSNGIERFIHADKGCVYTLQFAHGSLVIANDIENMMRKLTAKYRQRGLSVNLKKQGTYGLNLCHFTTQEQEHKVNKLLRSGNITYTIQLWRALCCMDHRHELCMKYKKILELVKMKAMRRSVCSHCRSFVKQRMGVERPTGRQKNFTL